MTCGSGGMLQHRLGVASAQAAVGAMKRQWMQHVHGGRASNRLDSRRGMHLLPTFTGWLTDPQRARTGTDHEGDKQ
jgi:hypothetical protein